MPLYKSITINACTKLLIWKIDETFDALSRKISLTDRSNFRLLNMKSDLHRRGFISIRHLLALEGYTDHDLYYDDHGKPHLKDDKHISITHSFNFAAIIVSDFEVGIDIEQQRNKILKIAHKFTPIEEYRTIANEDAMMRKLTIVWCAKESLYKSFASPGVSFLDNIYVEEFMLEDGETTAKITFQQQNVLYKVVYFEFENFTCAYSILQKD